MGAVACEQHGTHPGLLCCDHVRNALDQRGLAPSFDTYRLLLDDVEVHHLICAECAERFSLTPQEPIAEELWEEETFPDVAPACVSCLKEWARGLGLAL